MMDPGLLLALPLLIRRQHPSDAAFDKRVTKRREANKKAKQARKDQRKKR